MNLSPHFTLEELDGLGAPEAIIRNLRETAQRMEEFRAIVGAPFHVTSGYRSQQHNVAVGGSKTSDHPNGLAVDGTFSGLTMFEVWRRLFASGVDLPPFDQIIFYPFTSGHIHFGFGPRMRRQVLVKLNETDYAPISQELVGLFPGRTITIGAGALVAVIVAITVLVRKGKR
jgi:hypothetical protein